jgi:glycosyltransferase involved in cell wall biosynthesis
LVNEAVQNDIKAVLIVMSSPWDLFLGKSLMSRGIEVVRIIHDATPHPGEVFPPKFWIHWLIKDCSRIITLSQYVSDQISLNYEIGQTPVCVTPFPIPRTEIDRNNVTHASKKILLIGRGKRYQGQELLEEAWKLIKIPDAELVIAGDGFKKSQSLLGVEYKSYWMTDQELSDEIASSKFVVLPYIEASQSGIIAICDALEVPVVITPVGGLVEQVSHRKTGIIATEVTAKALAEAIQTAWFWDWKSKYSPNQFSREKFLQDCFQVK